MSGKVIAATAEGLEVETTYGKGNVLVKYEAVTSLTTDEPFVVLNGDDGKVRGKLVGVRDGTTLLVGDDAASATAVPVDTLFPSYSQSKFDESSLLRARALFRYWKAKYDMNFAATDATVNTLAFLTGYEVERRKSPTRFLTTGSWRYGTKDDPDSDPNESKTENELLGVLRGEYDLTKRFYTFAQGSAEYDEVESLSIRATPRAGVGVHIIDTKQHRWDVDVAGAYVYEDFFGDGQNDPNGYPAIAFGTEFNFTLPFGATLSGRGEYLPSVDDWDHDYLLRGTTTLAFPMTEWLSLQTGIVDQYDNTPAEDTDQNSLTLTAGAALVF
jgi:hypothetical protein